MNQIVGKTIVIVYNCYFHIGVEKNPYPQSGELVGWLKFKLFCHFYEICSAKSKALLRAFNLLKTSWVSLTSSELSTIPAPA